MLFWRVWYQLNPGSLEKWNQIPGQTLLIGPLLLNILNRKYSCSLLCRYWTYMHTSVLIVHLHDDCGVHALIVEKIRVSTHSRKWIAWIQRNCVLLHMRVRVVYHMDDIWFGPWPKFPIYMDSTFQLSSPGNLSVGLSVTFRSYSKLLKLLICLVDPIWWP